MLPLFTGIHDWLLSLGSAILTAAVIILLGIVFGAKVMDAIRGGFHVGIGFAGLLLLYRYFVGTLAPVASAFTESGRFSVVDVPWTGIGTLAMSAPFAIIVLPVMLFLTIWLLKKGWTRTLNLDSGGYSQFLLFGLFLQQITGSFLIGLISCFLPYFLCFYLSDRIANRWGESIGMPGTTCCNLSWLCTGGLVCWLVNKLFDAVPFLRRIDAQPKTMLKKTPVYMAEYIMGFVSGLFMALLTKQPAAEVIRIAFCVSACLVLMPAMLKIFGEGMSVFGEASQKWTVSCLGDPGGVYIAMDIAMTIGTPCAITATAVLLPTVMLIALLIPGYPTFPVGLLIMCPYVCGWCSMYSKQNFVRTVCSAVLLFLATQWIMVFVSPVTTEVCAAVFGDMGTTVTSGMFGDLDFLLAEILHRIVTAF